MQLRRSFKRLCLLYCLFVLPLLTGCEILPSLSLGLGTSTPVPSTNTVDTWNKGITGVETRQEVWQNSDGSISDTVTIVRFDLHYVKLNVAYQPDQPLSMQEWMQQEKPLALINGGYFDGQGRATALVIADGQVSGTSYEGFGGMLNVNAAGQVQLRSLIQQPYDASEHLTQATQSSPMLMLNGKRTEFNANDKASPRSVVALDKKGRLLFIVSPGLAFTLDEMADLLEKSDLGLVTALNLDGGSSTGLYVHAGDQRVELDSYVNLPLVIAVKKK